MAAVITPSQIHQGTCDECKEWTQVGWYIWESKMVGVRSVTLCEPCVQIEVEDDPYSPLIDRTAVGTVVTCNGSCPTYHKLCWD